MGVCDGSWWPQAIPQGTGVSEKLLDRIVSNIGQSNCDITLGRPLLVSLIYLNMLGIIR